MTDEIPAAVTETFEGHDAYEAAEGGYELTTTVFDATVSAAVGPDGEPRFTVTVLAPTLSAATAGEASGVVAEDWFETLERRLADAPKATRASVELDSWTVGRTDGRVAVEYTFTCARPAGGPAVAKTFVEYIEGTYVEGIVPGYDYQPPVSDLIANASQSGEHGTPL